MEREFAAVFRQILTVAALLAGTGAIATVLIAVSERVSSQLKIVGRAFAASATSSIVAVILSLVATILLGVIWAPYATAIALLAGVLAVIVTFVAAAQLLRALQNLVRNAYGTEATLDARKVAAGLGVAAVVVGVLWVVVGRLGLIMSF
ncbi:MAG: hypothetical protein U0031_05735 [Thermomicrobiales bacterium]